MRLHPLLFFVALIWAESSAARDHTIFIGVPLKQWHIEGAEMDCPEGGVCMDVPFRWRIRVESTVSGSPVRGIVRAAMIQHTRFIYADGQRALFVVYKIEDEAKRKLLGADYWIVEYVPAKEVFCPRERLESYGLKDDESSSFGAYADTGCYANLTYKKQ